MLVPAVQCLSALAAASLITLTFVITFNSMFTFALTFAFTFTPIYPFWAPGARGKQLRGPYASPPDRQGQIFGGFGDDVVLCRYAKINQVGDPVDHPHSVTPSTFNLCNDDYCNTIWVRGAVTP